MGTANPGHGAGYATHRDAAGWRRDVFSIMAVMSLFVAFAALWLASDARRRTDDLTHEFLNTHIKGVRNKVADGDRKINELAAQFAKLAKALKIAEDARARNEKSLASINADIQKLRRELDQLDQSIPSRYRVRVHAAQSQ